MNHAVGKYSVHDPIVPSSTPKVLCIDDDPDISFAIEQHLRQFDLHVLRSFHGMHGFTLAVQELPAVIIMDLAMPQGDGKTILEWLRRNRQTATIPAIVLTGMRDRNLAQKLFELGADQFLTKPVRCDELVHELSRFVDVRRRRI